ncbi:hypothetical protein D3C74_504400 [compost metagenome]
MPFVPVTPIIFIRLLGELKNTFESSAMAKRLSPTTICGSSRSSRRSTTSAAAPAAAACGA